MRIEVGAGGRRNGAGQAGAPTGTTRGAGPGKPYSHAG
jgi:hypothetical protein